MAKVVLTSGMARQFTGGETEFDIEATNVRGIMRALESRFPGLGTLVQNEMAIAIDGEIFQEPYLESVNADSEVFLLPKLGGGLER